MRRTLLFAIVLLSLAFPASALASRSFSSTITIHWTQNGSDSIFYGVVGSQKHACISNRHVKVVYSLDQSSYTPYASTFTNGDGTWATVHSGSMAGWYRAIAVRRALPNVTCRRAISEPFGLF